MKSTWLPARGSSAGLLKTLEQFETEMREAVFTSKRIAETRTEIVF